jgi:hypothetical protein
MVVKFSLEKFTTKFRNYEDDVWYIIIVTIKDSTKLRIRLKKITDNVDQFFEPSFFGSLEDFDDFKKRFRHSPFMFRIMIVVSSDQIC